MKKFYKINFKVLSAVLSLSLLFLGFALGTEQMGAAAASVKNLRLDTTAQYKCREGDEYRFVAYTSSPTPPFASASNDIVSVKYQRKVAGGYEYLMTASSYKDGYSLVRVTSGGETVSFPVLVDYTFTHSVESDTHQIVSLAKGESYTFKFTIMGGGEPEFVQIYQAVPAAAGIMKLQLVKKDGPDYYVKATATGGKVGEEAYVCIQFPNSHLTTIPSYSSYGGIKIKAGASAAPMKSDTTADFTIAERTGYLFKITSASKFVPGTDGVFSTKLVSRSGGDSFYMVTAVGQPGQQVGFYMSNGTTTQRVCIVTVGAPAMKSDTTRDFSVVRGGSYTFKLSSATNFVAGSPGVFKTQLVKQTSNDSFYKITAVGKIGSCSGLYMSVPGHPAIRACIVSIK